MRMRIPIPRLRRPGWRASTALALAAAALGAAVATDATSAAVNAAAVASATTRHTAAPANTKTTFGRRSSGSCTTIEDRFHSTCAEPAIALSDSKGRVLFQFKPINNFTTSGNSGYIADDITFTDFGGPDPDLKLHVNVACGDGCYGAQSTIDIRQHDTRTLRLLLDAPLREEQIQTFTPVIFWSALGSNTHNETTPESGSPFRCNGPMLPTSPDNKVGVSAGCVYTEITPTLMFNGRVPFINANIAKHQKSGATRLLHRNSAARPGNYNTVCGRQVPQARVYFSLTTLPSWPKDAKTKQPEKPSCDEYPFASTREGGVPGNFGWVPLSEQSIQGGLVNAFYVSQHILDTSRDGQRIGDAFTVQVNPNVKRPQGYN